MCHRFVHPSAVLLVAEVPLPMRWHAAELQAGPDAFHPAAVLHQALSHHYGSVTVGVAAADTNVASLGVAQDRVLCHLSNVLAPLHVVIVSVRPVEVMCSDNCAAIESAADLPATGVAAAELRDSAMSPDALAAAADAPRD